jgi:hypothetical protein
MTNFNLGNSVDNIQITENVLSKEEHKKLLDYATGSDHWETQPWGVKFIVSREMPEEIVDMLEKIFTIAYKKSIDFYNVDLRVFEKTAIPLIKFEKGYKMNEHADTTGDIAAIYYLNDDYEGGEINFMDFNLKIKPKANSFIIFPSNADYWHEVLENTIKERYSSTLWFQFTGSSTVRPKLGLTR